MPGAGLTLTPSLPLSLGPATWQVVSLLVTEFGVFDVKPNGGGMVLREIAKGTSLEELRAMTKASFEVADDLKEMPC